MTEEIIDEFTRRDVTRQRKYQLRQRKQGNCETCGKPAPAGLTECDDCAERNAKAQGHKRRYRNTARTRARVLEQKGP